MEPTFQELVFANIKRIMRECEKNGISAADLPEYEVHLHERHMDWVMHTYPSRDGSHPSKAQYGASIYVGNVRLNDSSICWPIMLEIYDVVTILYSELIGQSIQQIVTTHPNFKIAIKCESAFKAYVLERFLKMNEQPRVMMQDIIQQWAQSFNASGDTGDNPETYTVHVVRNYDYQRRTITYTARIPSDAPKYGLYRINIEKVDSETWGLTIWDNPGDCVVSYWGSMDEIEDYMIEEFKLSINFCDDKGVITK
jgi:hypothetical protein